MDDSMHKTILSNTMLAPTTQLLDTDLDTNAINSEPLCNVNGLTDTSVPTELGLQDNGNKRVASTTALYDDTMAEAPTSSDMIGGDIGSIAPEFSAVDEYKLKHSFRPITTCYLWKSSSFGTNKQDMTSSNIFSYTGNWESDNGRLTPETTASGPKKSFSNSLNEENKEFRVDEFQDSSSKQTVNRNEDSLIHSTRQLLGPVQSTSHDTTASGPKKSFSNSLNEENNEFGVGEFQDSSSKQTVNRNVGSLIHSTRQLLGSAQSTSHDTTASSPKRFFTGENNAIRVNGLQDRSSKQTNVRSLIHSTRQLLGPVQSTSPDTTPAQLVDTRYLPSRANDFGEENLKPDHCFCKFLVFIAVLVLAIGGLVLVVISQSDSGPGALTGKILEDDTEDFDVIKDCPDITVGLRERMEFICSTVNQARAETLVITPPAYVNKGEDIYIALSSDNQTGWMASLDIGGRLNVTGPEALCSSTGVYRFTLTDKNNASLYVAEARLIIRSEILQVNVTLNQPISNSSSDFTVGCSTNSGCEQSFVELFADQQEQPLQGVNFTCLINYNYYDGYGVSCVGTIPDFLMSQFGKITCRPKSSLLDNFTKEEIKDLEQVLELPECDISKHCGYKCENRGDYYVVNSGRCDIYHRCYESRVYTGYCAPGTFFDPSKCACRHTTELEWCQESGALDPEKFDSIPQKECNTENP